MRTAPSSLAAGFSFEAEWRSKKVEGLLTDGSYLPQGHKKTENVLAVIAWWVMCWYATSCSLSPSLPSVARTAFATMHGS